jgi:menaquinone-dependent protoporphyrinogen IX oxidase
MKGIVIYKGKYGATKQYAEWLGQALSLPVVTTENINGNQLKEFDYLLMGSSVYIGKLQIKKWLKMNTSVISDKKVFFFQVAASPPEEKEKRQAYNQTSIPEELRNKFEFYFLPGRMIMKKLSWLDRFMLKIGARFTKDPEAKKGMLTEFDAVSKDKIYEMSAAVKKYLHAGTPAVQRPTPLQYQ